MSEYVVEPVNTIVNANAIVVSFHHPTVRYYGVVNGGCHSQTTRREEEKNKWGE